MQIRKKLFPRKKFQTSSRYFFYFFLLFYLWYSCQFFPNIFFNNPIFSTSSSLFLLCNCQTVQFLLGLSFVIPKSISCNAMFYYEILNVKIFVAVLSKSL